MWVLQLHWSLIWPGSGTECRRMGITWHDTLQPCSQKDTQNSSVVMLHLMPYTVYTYGKHILMIPYTHLSHHCMPLDAQPDSEYFWIWRFPKNFSVLHQKERRPCIGASCSCTWPCCEAAVYFATTRLWRPAVLAVLELEQAETWMNYDISMTLIMTDCDESSIEATVCFE